MAEFDKAAHQEDVADLMRKLLQGVKLEDINFVDRLNPDERLAFLKYCAQLVESPFFPKMWSMLYYPHIMAAATTAENYDIVTFHRATANGVSLVKEFFEKYARLYEAEVETDKSTGFDKDKPFTETDAEQLFRI